MDEDGGTVVVVVDVVAVVEGSEDVDEAGRVVVGVQYGSSSQSEANAPAANNGKARTKTKIPTINVTMFALNFLASRFYQAQTS